MARIISTFSLGIDEVRLLEAFSVRHKQKKSAIVGNLLRQFLVLQSCTSCETEIAMRPKREYNYGNKKPEPNPATFGYHFHETGKKFFHCINCANISKDHISQMQLDGKPFMKVGPKPSQKWEWTLINNLSANQLREYQEGHNSSVKFAREI